MARDSDDMRDPVDSGLYVYATMAGLAGVVPVPLVDRVIARRVAAGALRRVATRHGVTIAPDAVTALLSAANRRATGTRSIVRSIAGRLLPPLQVASRVEDALQTFCTAALVDRYLRHRPAAYHGVLARPEAERIRRAIDGALPHGALAAAKAAPSGAATRVKDATKGPLPFAERVDRLIDGILDAIADAPGAVGQNIEEAFDRMVIGELGEGS